MRWVLRIFVGAWLGVCLAGGRGAPAAIQGSLPEGSGGGAGGHGWELIEVTFVPRAGEVDVSLQDVRGGVRMVRRVAGGTGRAWLSLPLLAPAELRGAAGGIWRVKAAAGNPAGGELEQGALELALGRGGSMRLATSQAERWEGAGSWVAVKFSEEEILSAPALVFAGCDLVELSPGVQARMTRARALALWAVGVRLVARGQTPPAGDLSLPVWEQSNLLGPAVWMTPALPLARPALLEPGLGGWRESGSEPAATVPADVTGVLVGVTPAAVVALLLVRGLFRRRKSVLAGGVLALAGLGGGAILCLRTMPAERVALAQWRQAPAGGTTAVGGALLEEELARYDARFQKGIEVKSDSVLYPVAATLGEYWAFSGLQIHLAENEVRLTGTAGTRRGLHVESRSAENLGLLPAFPKNATEQARLEQALHVTAGGGWWLIDGYVRPAGGAGAAGKPGMLLPAWAASRPWGRVAGSAWYEMRFQAGHRYYLIERAGEVGVEIVDFPPPAEAGSAAP